MEGVLANICTSQHVLELVDDHLGCGDASCPEVTQELCESILSEVQEQTAGSIGLGSASTG